MPTGGFGKFCHFWVYRRSHTCAGLYAYTEKSWGNYNEKISEIKSHLFENINKIDKPLARMMKKKEESSNCWNQESKNWQYWPYRNKKDFKGILWTILCQQIKQLWCINFQKDKTTEADLRKNRKAEQICNK